MGWTLLIILVAVALFAISIYNRLVAGRNRFKNAFAQIDVQLTRRYDLIPNLVETAKGYMKHERETLEAVITARNAAGVDSEVGNTANLAETVLPVSRQSGIVGNERVTRSREAVE